ncbi:hypothetical protein FOMPIDRAFT_1055782 [Fomitopsis schrenkii]|uniref:Uncharacterized protein n=1 Tax=Fomitopsis schrenkii TaxID=2126942 RepID=S8F405_FOMSC|nr:hypothetical protein FOMPIDRAFT_1055782 [Fomitopsis schrenkii]
MLDYFDEVFKDRDLPEIERVGVPFLTLAWSEAAVLYKQTQPNTRLAVGLPMYTTVPTYLDDYRSLPTIVREMSRLVDRLLEASRDKPSEPTDGPDDTMPALVPEPATNPAGPSLIDMLRASNTLTGKEAGDDTAALNDILLSEVVSEGRHELKKLSIGYHFEGTGLRATV